MTAETFDEYIIKTFRMYAREKGIDLKSIALGSLESGKDIDDCETDFNWKLKDYVYDFKEVIGQYMADDIESAVLSSIELGDVVDLDDYFYDDGVCYSRKSGKSSKKKAPTSKSPKLRYFNADMSPDDMADIVATELVRCGLDKGYPGFDPEPNWDVYNDCYYYFDSGEEEDMRAWADAVRPKCPKAAAMIEEAIRIFDEDGSFEAQQEMYDRIRAMSSPASSGKKRTTKGRAPAGKSRSRPSGKGTGRTPAKSRPPASKASKTKTAPAKNKGVRR